MPSLSRKTKQSKSRLFRVNLCHLSSLQQLIFLVHLLLPLMRWPASRLLVTCPRWCMTELPHVNLEWDTAVLLDHALLLLCSMLLFALCSLFISPHLLRHCQPKICLVIIRNQFLLLLLILWLFILELLMWMRSLLLRVMNLALWVCWTARLRVVKLWLCFYRNLW